MSPADRVIVGVTADLLDRGRTIDALSSALSIVAALCLLLTALGVAGAARSTALWFALAIVGFGLLAKYLAVRVAFDAALLNRCAAEHMPTAEFDAAMRVLGLMSAKKTGRNWTDRCLGARRLLTLQAILLVVQTIALAFAVIAAR